MTDATTPSPSMTAPATVSPPSAPMLTQAPAPPPAPDDITDPPVPPAVLEALTAPPAPGSPPQEFNDHEALLVGFCATLQQKLHGFMLDEHKGIMQTLDATLVALRKWVDTVGQQNEHSQYQLSDALLKLQEQGLALRHDPYTVNVQALSPQGYPLTLHIAKSDVGELITALPALCAWLHENGYAPQQSAVYP